ncbi:hypothetical protein GLGCALEP_04742 [Pseudomonas sp. MM221]|nr:hypothetical protein GLGCALEP_04742 [Pseudomonas sp. MM221]
MAELPDGHELENLLLASAANDNLALTLQLWGDVYSGDIFVLLVNDEEVGARIRVEDDDQPSLQLILPAPHREGNYIISYTHYLDGTTPKPGPTQLFTVLLTPPGGDSPPPLYVTADIRLGLTKDKLEPRGGKNYLATEVHNYSHEMQGDTFAGQINGEKVTVLVETDTGKTLLLFAEDDIVRFEELSRTRSPQNTMLEFNYTITSLTGLSSNDPVPLALEVLIAAAIPDLKEPSLSAKVDPIGEKDARNNLEIIIPAHTGDNKILPGDTIIVSMGEFNFPPTPIPDDQENKEFSLTLMFRNIYLEWERASAGANTVIATAFSYTIMRDTLKVGTSGEMSVGFNLFMVGGRPDLDSQLPRTPHPQLWRPTLMGNNAHGIPNYITETEMNAKLPATLWIPGFDVNDQPIFAANDHVKISYDGEVVVDEQVDPADLDSDKMFSFTLDGETIYSHGLGPMLLDASVTRVVAGGANNTSYMDYTVVAVENVEDLPAKPGTGTYTPATGDPNFSLEADVYTTAWLLEHELTLTIAAYDGMAEGDIINVYGEQYQNFDHNDGEGDAEHLVDGDFHADHVVKNTEVGSSAVIDLPVARILKPNTRSHLHVTVTVTRDGKESRPNSDTPLIKISSRS